MPLPPTWTSTCALGQRLPADTCAEERRENDPQACGVAPDHCAGALADDPEVDLRVLERWAQQIDGTGDQGAPIDWGFLQSQLPCLDAGQVEQFVDGGAEF